jgi:hypothetical protein
MFKDGSVASGSSVAHTSKRYLDALATLGLLATVSQLV